MKSQAVFSALAAIAVAVAFASTGTAAEPPPILPASARDAQGFTPEGWRVQQSARGDLNGDGLPDLAVALGSAREETADPAGAVDSLPRRCLVVAWGRSAAAGGGFQRAAVDNTVILARYEGGVYGDPFAGLRIERGALVVEHYGGSRNRWGTTDRYRWQNGGFERIGHTETAADTAAPDYAQSRDENLSTGLVEERQRGVRPEEPDLKPYRIAYYALRAPGLSAAPPPLSDTPLTRPAVNLRTRADVARGTKDWKGETDLSATLSAAVSGSYLYLRARVRDNRVLAGGDTVQLVGEKGKVVPPVEFTVQPVTGGYRWQGCYALTTLGLSKDRPLLHATVEVIDFDAPGRAHAALSTSRAGRKETGEIRWVRRPGLPRLGDGSAEEVGSQTGVQ